MLPPEEFEDELEELELDELELDELELEELELELLLELLELDDELLELDDELLELEELELLEPPEEVAPPQPVSISASDNAKAPPKLLIRGFGLVM